LNKLKPTLQLFGANGEFSCSKWKTFRKDYNVTSATIQVLSKALDKEFFSSTKRTRNKHRTIEELSPNARQFFQVFFKQKKVFVKLAGRAFFRPYNGMNNKPGLWLESSWDSIYRNSKLGIIDFKRKPN
jgi:hypothetical protein